MLVHFSCERMDDNISSFLTGGKIGKWFARRVIGNYILPNFDFHIANSPYTAEEFYKSIEKSENPHRSERILNWCWRFFKAPRISLEERDFCLPARRQQPSSFRPRENPTPSKARCASAPRFPKIQSFCFTPDEFRPKKIFRFWSILWKILARDTKKDYRLLVAGAGPQSDWLKKETEKHVPGKIIQLGHLDKNLLPNYYASADVFVHPNPREPFGIAPLEAMASGVPVVAPNAGGILSYATDENIWLVEPTGENFASAIQAIIENPTADTGKGQKRSGNGARQHAGKIDRQSACSLRPDV